MFVYISELYNVYTAYIYNENVCKCYMLYISLELNSLLKHSFYFNITDFAVSKCHIINITKQRVSFSGIFVMLF